MMMTCNKGPWLNLNSMLQFQGDFQGPHARSATTAILQVDFTSQWFNRFNEILVALCFILYDVKFTVFMISFRHSDFML